MSQIASEPTSLRSLGRQLAREMRNDEVAAIAGGDTCGNCCVDPLNHMHQSPNCGPDPCGDDPGPAGQT